MKIIKFSISVKNAEVKINRKTNEQINKDSLIDRLRFMSASSSNLPDDLSDDKLHGKSCDCYCRCLPEYEKI